MFDFTLIKNVRKMMMERRASERDAEWAAYLTNLEQESYNRRVAKLWKSGIYGWGEGTTESRLRGKCVDKPSNARPVTINPWTVRDKVQQL